MSSTRSLEFHPEAAEEVGLIVGWYVNQSVDAASNFEIALNRVLDAIVESPKRFQHRWGSFRHALLAGFPYAVIFRESSNRIQVLAVAHHARRPGYWLSRLQH